MTRNTRQEHNDKLRDRSKFIFEFWDGDKNRRVDGFKLLLQIQDKFAMAFAAGDANPELMSKFIVELREKLNLKEYSEESDSGLTDGEILNIARDFVSFISDKKKRVSTKPTSPKPMVQVS